MGLPPQCSSPSRAFHGSTGSPPLHASTPISICIQWLPCNKDQLSATNYEQQLSSLVKCNEVCTLLIGTKAWEIGNISPEGNLMLEQPKEVGNYANEHYHTRADRVCQVREYEGGIYYYRNLKSVSINTGTRVVATPNRKVRGGRSSTTGRCRVSC